MNNVMKQELYTSTRCDNGQWDEQLPNGEGKLSWLFIPPTHNCPEGLYLIHKDKITVGNGEFDFEMNDGKFVIILNKEERYNLRFQDAQTMIWKDTDGKERILTLQQLVVVQRTILY
jgi:hypothetical protein